MNDTTARRAGLAVVAMAGLSVAMAPLNALARMRTDSGQSDLDNPLARWWADPALQTLEPLVDWGAPDTVYETYGKFYLFALLAVLACAAAVRSRRRARLRFSERWGWRLTLTSYGLMTVSMFFTYWIANLDLVFLAVTLPALLLNTIGETMLGIGLIRSGFRPRLTAWVLALSFPLSQALVMISTQALGMWPMMLAWGAAGWSLWRTAPESVPATEPNPVTA
jgi:hypothetical protein